eukprot:jgi/Chrzof1/12820/Cz07g08200.t1
MQVYNFCLLGFVLIGYLWPNLQLNTKSNPLFKHIQIDLYDPLRIQHESLPHQGFKLTMTRSTTHCMDVLQYLSLRCSCWHVVRHSIVMQQMQDDTSMCMFCLWTYITISL